MPAINRSMEQSGHHEWYWTDGLRVYGEWIWNNGEAWQSYKSFWAEGHPHECRSSHHCRHCLAFSGKTGEWKSENCSKAHSYICKIPPVSATELLSHQSKCLDGWSYVTSSPESSGMCYQRKWVVNSGDWTFYRNTCREAGGDLVSIHSKEQNEAFIDWATPVCTKEFVWSPIGLFRAVDGNWTWTDGTPVDYFNWRKGEPSVDTNIRNVHVKAYCDYANIFFGRYGWHTLSQETSDCSCKGRCLAGRRPIFCQRKPILTSER
jgi:hypothetical protein